jgi:hypothetical protein
MVGEMHEHGVVVVRFVMRPMTCETVISLYLG